MVWHSFFAEMLRSFILRESVWMPIHINSVLIVCHLLLLLQKNLKLSRNIVDTFINNQIVLSWNIFPFWLVYLIFIATSRTPRVSTRELWRGISRLYIFIYKPRMEDFLLYLGNMKQKIIFSSHITEFLILKFSWFAFLLTFHIRWIPIPGNSFQDLIGK